MDSVAVSSIVKRQCNGRYKSDYNIDFWEEVKKRWLIFGVLFSILLAVLAPRLGAPGGNYLHCMFTLDHGLLHTEYTSLIPLSYIYYAAGCRSRISRAELREHARLCAMCVAHAHIAAPALSVVTVAAFEDVVDYRIIKGALLSSIGGPCGWLSLAVCSSPGAAVAVAACYVTSLVATPLGMFILCGRAPIPPLSSILPSLFALPPFIAGVLRPRPHPASAPKLVALVLLYADCCTRLTEAEGSLYVGDVLVTLLLELCYVFSSCAACCVYARCGLLTSEDARTLALCAVPKALQHGWEWSLCGAWGLSRLPAVLLAPAHALLLAGANGVKENGA